jgi:adenosylcobinamide kinase/adenosylcobinamide-phosphate guanylyltransferase
MVVLGGAQSGKSDFVTELSRHFDEGVWWGTASEIPQDADWRERLELLRRGRKNTWTSLEGPWAWPPAAQADAVQHGNKPLFIFDSLNLWLAAHIQRGTSLYSFVQLKTHLDLEFQQLCESLARLPCPVLIVSAEVGSGVVPQGEFGRLFRDLLGLWNRHFVSQSHHGVSLQAGRAFLWPAGRQRVPSEGTPVLCVDSSHIARLLKPL